MLRSISEQERTAHYAAALLIGVLWSVTMLPWPTLSGTGGLFAHPQGDLPMHLSGHLAFQVPGWHWPLLRAPALAWPAGESIAMTDSNPALSIAAKLIAGAAGHPVNLFGAWLLICFLLQPVAAVYLLHGFMPASAAGQRLNRFVAAAALASLTLLLPEYLFRVIHINLMAQFLLLFCLGVAVRCCTTATAPRFTTLFAWLVLAVLVHPYLFMFCTAVLAAPLVGMLIRRQHGARAHARHFGLAALLPVGIFVLLSGELGTGGPGYGLYSTNLLSPVWPQYSGLFGAGLPLLDATGYQHEGFNYFGAGILLLLASAAVCLLAAQRKPQRVLGRWGGLLVVLAALTCLAVTPHVTLGHVDLLPWQSPVLEQVFGVVRASGRAIWAVDYAVLAAALALLAARLRPRLFVPLALFALLLQWVDTAPLRAGAMRYLAGEGQPPPAFAMPRGTTLFRAVPLCGAEDVVATEYRLAALRAGARLADMRLVHPQVETTCQRALQDGLGAAMAAGETRLFMASVQARVRPDALGTGVICQPVAIGRVCHRAGP